MWVRAVELRRRSETLVHSAAHTAESMAATLERLCATYQWMGDTAVSATDAARLRGHCARVKNLADRERSEALRCRLLLERAEQ